jgi:ArsR family transcriptional regulator, zinc-responsive transcriptional repressor
MQASMRSRALLMHTCACDNFARVVSDPTISAAAALFKALSTETRLSIVHRLATGPACVHELVSELGLSQPLVSQHLRVLRGADVVRGTRRGKEIAYAIADDHVGHLVADAVAHAGEGVSTAGSSLTPDDEMEHPA